MPVPLPNVVEAADWCTVQGKLKLETAAGSASNSVVVLASAIRQETRVHAELARTEPRTFDLTVTDNRLKPAITIMRPGDELILRNADSHGYPLYFPFLKKLQRTLALNPGDEKRISITHAEPYPVQPKGLIHTLSNSLLVILDHPYAAIPDDDGSFRLELVPTGQYDLLIRHPGGMIKKRIVLKQALSAIGTLLVSASSGEERVPSVVIEP
ncbi:MAG: hypothetical protein AAGD07_23800 [Planctomycetota bacterium]